MPKIPHLASSVLYKVGARELLKELTHATEIRFSDLAKLPIFSTTATLAHRLRELEGSGHIKKSIHNEPGKPVHIFYSITDKGRKALGLLEDMENL